MHCVCLAWFVPVELLSVGWRGYFFFYWNSEYGTLRLNDTNTIDKYKPCEVSWLTDPKLWQEYYWFRFISSSSTIYSLCLWPTYSDLMKSLNYHHQFNNMFGMQLNGYPKGKQAIVFVFIFITEIWSISQHFLSKAYIFSIPALLSKNRSICDILVETYHINLMDIRS